MIYVQEMAYFLSTELLWFLLWVIESQEVKVGVMDGLRLVKMSREADLSILMLEKYKDEEIAKLIIGAMCTENTRQWFNKMVFSIFYFLQILRCLE